MMQFHSLLVRRASGYLTLAMAALCVAAFAHAEATANVDGAPIGRLNFEAANLPEANVEVDLSQEMFKDLFGIGDAALAGVAESLLKSVHGSENAEGTKLAAGQLEAARQIMQLAGNVIREVRVRIYQELPDDADDAQKLYKPFDEQLRAGKWESLARVRNDEDVVRISAIRKGGALQGIFIVASDGESVALVNVVCDVSPENVKKLTAAATKVGLENGLAQAIESKMKNLTVSVEANPTIVIRNASVETHEAPPVPASPAAPPAPPKPPAPPIEK